MFVNHLKPNETELIITTIIGISFQH